MDAEELEEIARTIEPAKKIRTAFWTNEEVDEKFAKRNAGEIVLEKDAFYLAPCLDYALVMIQMLKGRGVSLVAEQNVDRGYGRLHFAVEDGDRKWHAHYIGGNLIKISSGGYRNIKKVKSGTMARFVGDKISQDSDLCGIAGISSLGELSITFPGYDLEKQLERPRRINSPEMYKRFLEMFGGELRIIC